MRILLIDDDATTLLLAQRRLTARGHVVEARTEVIGTTNAVRRFKPELVVLDLDMPTIEGAQLAKLIGAAGLDVRLVLFSALERGALATRASELGAAGFVHKDEAASLPDRLEALVG